MKSDIQYSTNFVYNNYLFPQGASLALRKKVEAVAQAVLDIRAAHPNASFAALYGVGMPPELTKAHAVLDKTVDACYRKEKFENDTERIRVFVCGVSGLVVGAYVKYKGREDCHLPDLINGKISMALCFVLLVTFDFLSSQNQRLQALQNIHNLV